MNPLRRRAQFFGILAATAAIGVLYPGCSSDSTNTATPDGGQRSCANNACAPEGGGSDGAITSDGSPQPTNDSGGADPDAGDANAADTGSGDADANAGDADAADGDSGDGAADNTVSCANYCTKVASKCTAADAQYTDNAQCMTTCALMTPGTYAETANSVGCRQYHAGNTPASVHCPHAGPFGGAPSSEVCVPAGGDHCDDFCQIAVGQCPNAFANLAACKTACVGFTVDATKPYGISGPTSGNTFNCRSYHLMAAITTPAVHCAHIVAASATCQ